MQSFQMMSFMVCGIFFLALTTIVVTVLSSIFGKPKKQAKRHFVSHNGFDMANELHHQAHENAMRMHEQAHNMAVADHMRAVEHHNMVTNDLFVNNSIHDHMTAMDNHNMAMNDHMFMNHMM